ncbi:MAG: Acetolactate synthase large subunit IlvG [Syntrophus sp. SKADARSKE-3]|nr:Acetolactate synthase large subunit IlvG [Syntrophus sp. SKADARSKE-3]
MAILTGGRLVAKAMKQEGVEALFTLPGGHIMDIYSGCIDEGIRIIDVRHEQTAVHAAEAWTRLTGIAGVAAVTAGPGVTDAVTGVANAFRNQVPLILIGGQAPRKQARMGALQELDSVSVMKPLTKLSFTIYDTERIPELLSAAFREAYSGRPGPVFVEIPMDVMDGVAQETDISFPVRYRTKGRLFGDPEAIGQAADLLNRAKRPVILAGSQIWHFRAMPELVQCAERAQIPVYLNGAARGCLPAGFPLFMSRSRRHALSQADLVMVIGTPFDFRLGYGKRLSQDAKVIQIDIDGSEIGHNRDVDVGITGHARAVLGQIAAALMSSKHKNWLKALREKEAELSRQDQPFLNSSAQPIHPLRLAREIQAFMAEDAIFIADGGDVVTMAASVIVPQRPGSWLDPGPLGTLGVGTPFAIAAGAACPGREIIILFGDGAFGLTGFDYDTLIRFGMPVIGIVGNNAAWNQVRYGQIEKYGSQKGDVANILTPLRYDRVVEAMGGHGEFVTEPEEIRPALERARNSGKASLINVMVDRNVFSSGTMNQTMYK